MTHRTPHNGALHIDRVTLCKTLLDDLSYARKDQAEASVLFERIAERYERKILPITANETFSDWNDVFPDPGMTSPPSTGLGITRRPLNSTSKATAAARPATNKMHCGVNCTTTTLPIRSAPSCLTTTTLRSNDVRQLHDHATTTTKEKRQI
ncbi:ATP-binding protein [Paraburkholderia sp. BR14261]